MKSIAGVLVCIAALLLARCARPAAAPAPTPTSRAQVTAAPTETPEPTATARPTETPGPAVVGIIGSAEDLAGVWQKTTPGAFGMDVYRAFTEDGIYHMGTSVRELDERPRVEGEFQFKGNHFVMQEFAAIPGLDVCTKAAQVGTYTVELLENGHIRFVVVEDECSDRVMMLDSNEMEPVH